MSLSTNKVEYTAQMYNAILRERDRLLRENAGLEKELRIERQARTNAEFRLLALENPIPPEIRAKMDADRAKAIAAREAVLHTLCEMEAALDRNVKTAKGTT